MLTEDVNLSVYRSAVKSLADDLLPDVFCFMVRIFLLLLVLLHVFVCVCVHI